MTSTSIGTVGFIELCNNVAAANGTIRIPHAAACRALRGD
ncbi:coproporphyrinogen III oxidase [Burkholderia thailandensis]|nr:coproporphyrinogen III oxidase [Burkholderia thailandensis]AVR11556.1 coproporphyrinogen III oxidase [Burkholderia thailandensis]AVR25581.1 coproporphyrinogen III oxidase [Burkholderia thailandensis]AWY58854.1 coproporphyrinogen III oxidase [Burkholderia thailandensis]AWY66976.1 coproporphyrinogen III oxidase [Burkholderia thailandensis]MBS2127654.1 coproporphyrinogen III oxidase [Burkholderia thailandensis]